jgi:phage tail-like protein
MAIARQYPYNSFNFQVKFGSTELAFQEVTGLNLEVHVAEYRNGNRKDLAPVKVTGMYKVDNVSFKRGVCGDLASLYARVDSVRKGNGNSPTGGETVTINLMDDSNETVVQSWILTNARATKISGPSYNGKATDVAIEELVVMAEGITQA